MEINHTYPIGKFESPKESTAEYRSSCIQRIASLPVRLAQLASTLSDDELKFSCRENGWTCRQIIHHLADSHVNAYIRFKLALTEENPTIKPYNQDAFALFHDAELGEISTSILLLNAIHIRWTDCLERIQEAQFERTYFHPEYQTKTALSSALALYAWHGDHHIAQIEVAQKLQILS
jgi:uncharacterized damage-inducible protein DinB